MVARTSEVTSLLHAMFLMPTLTGCGGGGLYSVRIRLPVAGGTAVDEFGCWEM